MEPPIPLQSAPRRRLGRRKLIGILVAGVVAAATFGAWYILRPRSIGEVLSMEGFRAGDEVTVRGTITGIGRENTAYGSRVYLQLDSNTYCGGPAAWTANLVGDSGATYVIGGTYETRIRFEVFSINGDPSVWAAELACPFPSLLRAIGVVLDAASEVGGILLVYNGTDSAGWSRFDFETRNGTGFDPAVLPVDLLKALPFWEGVNRKPIESAREWREWSGVFYVMASAALGPQNPGFFIADRMTSLAAPASTNGSLRFVDADLNGLVNSGDRLEARLPPTGLANQWQAYLFRIGDFSFGPTGNTGVHVTLVGPTGPFEALRGAGGVSMDLRSIQEQRSVETGVCWVLRSRTELFVPST